MVTQLERGRFLGVATHSSKGREPDDHSSLMSFMLTQLDEEVANLAK